MCLKFYRCYDYTNDHLSNMKDILCSAFKRAFRNSVPRHKEVYSESIR